VPDASASEPGVTLSKPWMRMVITSRPVAGYFSVSNDSDQAHQLVGASSPDCGALMLHQSTSKGGVERMAMLKSVPVPAHGSVSFAPGGYHLMCMSPAPDVKVGSLVPVTLRFEDGGTLSANFPVRGPIGK
jgi:hypothetical protein